MRSQQPAATYKDCEDVFSEQKASQASLHSDVERNNVLREGNEPSDGPLYNLSENEPKVLRESCRWRTSSEVDTFRLHQKPATGNDTCAKALLPFNLTLLSSSQAPVAPIQILCYMIRAGLVREARNGGIWVLVTVEIKYLCLCI